MPVRVEFDAPSGCSDGEAFFAGVLARTRHVHRARPGETAVRLTVHVTRVGGRVHGELRVNEAGGEAETRRVDGATCAEVVQVLSLTAALAIDPTADLLAPAVPEKPPAAPSPVRAPPSAAAAPSSGRAAPAAAARAGGAAPLVQPPAVVARCTSRAHGSAGSTSGVSVAGDTARRRPGFRTAAAAHGRARPRRRSSRRSRGTNRPAASGPRFGASMVAARVLTSSVGLGASLWGRLGTTTREGLTPSVTLAALYLPG